AVSGIATLLFLGGWHLGIEFWPGGDFVQPLGYFFGNVINVVVFIAKGWILVFVMMWVRWTLPRLRIDQVMMTCLKYLLPLSCFLLLGVAVWQVAIPGVVLSYLKIVLALGCFALLILTIVQLVRTRHQLPFAGVPSLGDSARK